MSDRLLLLLLQRRRNRSDDSSDLDTGLMDTLTNVVGVLALIAALTSIFAASGSLNIQTPMAQRSRQPMHLLQANNSGVWDLQPAVDRMVAADRERVTALHRCQALPSPQQPGCNAAIDGWSRSAQVGSIAVTVNHRQGLLRRNGPPTSSAAELQRPGSWLDRTMANLGQTGQAVFVVLESDGFASYRAIKAKAQQYGVRLGWEPWPSGQPIHFWGNGGRHLTVQ